VDGCVVDDSCKLLSQKRFKTVIRHLICASLLLGPLSCGVVDAQNSQEKKTREDVVRVPAIGEGLCVSNVFQSWKVTITLRAEME